MEQSRGEDTPLRAADDPLKRNQAKGLEPREKWANKTEFLLSMAGEIIGLGNVWRFPYLCYRNGGGVFFIPYFVFLVFCGIPIFFLETALGQYTSQGGVTAWRKICPMFEGIGVASQVIVIYLNIYYIVVLAWALFYLFSCFQSPLPWTSCSQEWNTVDCHSYNQSMHRPNAGWIFLYNKTDNYSDILISSHSNFSEALQQAVVSPEEEFWLHRVQRVVNEDFLGPPHYDLALCLLLAWTICYFCIWKGVKSTGKVVYFTATFPYLMLLVLFFRGVTLPGAGAGITYYLYPDISKLSKPEVWLEAGTQVLFSYAVCQGVLTALGSYNKYQNNCYKDCVALCALNSATSIFAGFAVFSVLGYMCHELDLPMEDIVRSGPGLAFIAYPKALSLLPGPQFWSVLFFLMILFLGLDSQFVCVESLATALTDLFPGVLRKPKRREILVLVIAVICFLLGLPLITQGGIHLFKLVDRYGPSGTNLLFIACFESIVIAWVYGADRFYDNIKDMIGYPPIAVLKYCWLFVTPFICGINYKRHRRRCWLVVVFAPPKPLSSSASLHLSCPDAAQATLLYDLVSSKPLSSSSTFMPSWAFVVAGLLTAGPMLCIPAFILVSLKRDRRVISPSPELRQLQPHAPRLMLCGVIVFGRQGSLGRPGDDSEVKAHAEDTSRV
ncbi:sodium- and chloride-dependent GABA transporter 2-like isoform X1 [Electrophorus electricus]|uniref:sodium- and chloride-dependent GABA transporter 2-like isoform X1 n=1 Tax=Electrophorus electricus TaxID=8005 RepID=UPI0015CFFDA7|nr:sodium- and chloride-dependent GABA transporter 2-like isoform X1 [Electrophorus electricus]